MTEILDYYLIKPNIIDSNSSDTLSNIIKGKLSDCSFWETCLKNGCNVYASTNPDDKWPAQILNVFYDFVLGANVSLRDVFDYEQWTTDKTIKAISGGILNVLKNFLTNICVKKKFRLNIITRY